MIFVYEYLVVDGALFSIKLGIDLTTSWLMYNLGQLLLCKPGSFLSLCYAIVVKLSFLVGTKLPRPVMFHN